MLQLFLISFLALYFEIIFIRWVPGEVHLFGYFKNLVLLSAFTGLGLGFMRREKKQRRQLLLFPYLLLVLLILFWVGRGPLQNLSFSSRSFGFFLWGDASNHAASAGKTFLLLLFVGAMYLYICLLCLLIGSELGLQFVQFPPLKAYTINLAGSLSGLFLFTLFSAYATPPQFWFSVGFLILLLYWRSDPASLLKGALGIFLCLLFLFSHQESALWSPYYKIDIQPITFRIATPEGTRERKEYDLMVNGRWHQFTFQFPTKLKDRIILQHDRLLKVVLDHYEYPYRFGKRDRVLVLGAGTGNDVAAALLHGANRVDAVEIDPIILEIGKKVHANAPYSSSKVHIINDDARSFSRKTHRKYDHITFGLLDSQAVFSQLSTLRLDNFVYTVEGLQAMKALLAPHGIISLTFAVERDWLKKKIQKILTAVFHKKPLLFSDPGIVTYVIGEDIPLKEASPPSLTKEDLFSMPTDNWPHLYLKTRTIPPVYIFLLFLVLCLSLLFARIFAPDVRTGNLHFFFLGCGFMLIETQSITQLALLFGSTWQVNTLAIASVLVMAIVANILAENEKTINVTRLYLALTLLFLSLFLFPFSTLLGKGLFLKTMLATLLLTLPIFLAGLIFSSSLKITSNVQSAFGSNLLGAMVGGLLEYTSLLFGLHAMALVTLFCYLLSWRYLRRA